MNVSLITAPITLDSIRLTIESMMRNRATGNFYACAGAGTNILDAVDLPGDDANTFANSNDIMFGTPSTLSGGYSTSIVANEFEELEYELVSGRLEFDGLSTTGLPNGRRYWTSFGQLVEDVFFGRIPELVQASVLIIEQSTAKVFVAYKAAFLSTQTGNVLVDWEEGNQVILMKANEVKTSADFFE